MIPSTIQSLSSTSTSTRTPTSSASTTVITYRALMVTEHGPNPARGPIEQSAALNNTHNAGGGWSEKRRK
jgi:hypothetical protein